MLFMIIRVCRMALVMLEDIVLGLEQVHCLVGDMGGEACEDFVRKACGFRLPLL
jgi:hypothetical protein